MADVSVSDFAAQAHAGHEGLGRGARQQGAGLLCGLLRDGASRLDAGEGVVDVRVEVLNRHRWRTRLELPNAIFEYLEIFHNRQRRHSSLGMLTPIEYEIRHATTS